MKDQFRKCDIVIVEVLNFLIFIYSTSESMFAVVLANEGVFNFISLVLGRIHIN